ncbi:hypothetical protein C2845_PM07G26710 [Panicum miliaceum]|uniref:Uncharacterized protein n=1 Tax=Panicum miliaceum TaxID=4540 RepID=A0A3L6SKF5_PANMI|nr:hypothetical protein C2845_PM07G26710 [Panicum miliaceum]
MAARSSFSDRCGSPLTRGATTGAGERRPGPPTTCAPSAVPPPGAARHGRCPELLRRPTQVKPGRSGAGVEERRPGESVKGRCERESSVVARPRHLTSAFSPAWTVAWMGE